MRTVNPQVLKVQRPHCHQTHTMGSTGATVSPVGWPGVGQAILQQSFPPNPPSLSVSHMPAQGTAMC